jgi:hypothetical protein
MNKYTKLLAAVSLSAFAGAASAVPIEGSIGFGGAYSHDGTSLNDATTITITSATVSGVTTGSFLDAGIVDGDPATYSNFIFSPISTPISNIWTVGVFTFELTNMSVDFQSAALLALSGGGVFSTTDSSLDDANGQWTFTANETGANLTWSSSSAVPEPVVTLLLATGLIGFGFARRARKTA